MIVFLDQDSQNIMIVDKDIKVLSMSDIDSISEILMNKKVTYVTAATLTTGAEIIQLLKHNTSMPSSVQKTGKQFVHSITAGRIIVTNGANVLEFDNPLHFMSMTEIPDSIRKCQNFQRLIAAKKIEIIDESEIPNAKKKLVKYVKHVANLDNMKSQSVDLMLVNSSVKAADVAAGIADVGETIDLTDEKETEDVDADTDEATFIKNFKIQS